jgi:hypothetical protein
MMLRGLRVLVQVASLLNGLEFDPLTLFEDSLAGPEVDVYPRRCGAGNDPVHFSSKGFLPIDFVASGA